MSNKSSVPHRRALGLRLIAVLSVLVVSAGPVQVEYGGLLRATSFAGLDTGRFTIRDTGRVEIPPASTSTSAATSISMAARWTEVVAQKARVDELTARLERFEKLLTA